MNQKGEIIVVVLFSVFFYFVSGFVIWDKAKRHMQKCVEEKLVDANNDGIYDRYVEDLMSECQHY